MISLNGRHLQHYSTFLKAKVWSFRLSYFSLASFFTMNCSEADASATLILGLSHTNSSPLLTFLKALFYFAGESWTGLVANEVQAFRLR